MRELVAAGTTVLLLTTQYLDEADQLADRLAQLRLAGHAQDQASNVFVDPHTMPGWVQVFVNHNPITHLATASRGLMHGSVAAVEVAWVLAWSAALVAVFAPLTMRLYNKER